MITGWQENLRERALKITVWLLLIGMGISYLPGLLQRGERGVATRPVIATVNGIGIDALRYQQRVEQETEWRESLRARFKGIDPALLNSLLKSNPEEEALNALVGDALLDGVADKIGIAVDPQYLVQQLHDPQFMAQELTDVVPLSVINPQTGSIDESALRHHMARQGMTMTEFELLLEQKMQRIMLMGIAEASTTVLPQEIEFFITSRYQPRSYEVATLTFDEALKRAQKQEVSDAALLSFFTEQNKRSKRYWVPEQREGEVYTFEAKEWGAAPSSSALESFYQKNKALFIEKPAQVSVARAVFPVPTAAAEKEIQDLQETANTLVQKVKDEGKNFSALAQQMGATLEELPLFKRGTYDQDLERMAFRLGEDGQVSTPVLTDKGWEVLQRIKRTPVVYKTMAQAEPLIKERLSTQAFSIEFAQQAQRMLMGEKAPAAIKNFATLKKASLGTVGPVTKDATPAVLTKKLFSLTQGRWGFCVEASQGYIVHLTSIIKSYEPPFEAVKDQVKYDFYAVQAQKNLNSALADAHKKLAETQGWLTASAFKNLKTELGASTAVTPLLTPADEDQEKRESKLLPLSLSQIAHLAKQDQAMAFSYEKGIAVLRVKEVGALDKPLSEGYKNALSTHFWAQRFKVHQQGLVASLRRNATLDISKVQRDK